MPNFEKIDPNSASGRVADIFADIMRTLNINFVPQFFQTLANSPTVLEGTWAAYRNVGWRGTLPSSLKEMIFTAISNDRECRYCEAAHLAFCRKVGVDNANLRAVIKDIEQVRPAEYRDVIRFALAASRDPGKVSREEFKQLRDHGYDDENIVEILAMVSFSLYAINLAETMRLDIDGDFLQLLGGSVSQATV